MTVRPHHLTVRPNLRSVCDGGPAEGRSSHLGWSWRPSRDDCLGYRCLACSRCACRVVASVCDAWPAGLILGLHLQPAPGTGLQRPETEPRKSRISLSPDGQRPNLPRLNRAKARKSGPIGQRRRTVGSQRNAWWRTQLPSNLSSTRISAVSGKNSGNLASKARKGAFPGSIND